MLAEYLSEFAAAEKPTQPSQAGLAKMDIKGLQNVLVALREKITPDGLFGPMTKAAWQRQATKYNQNNAFDRAGPTTAWVSMPTYLALSRAAYPVRPAPMPPPAPAVTPSTAIVPSRPGTVVRTVLELQDLLYGVGWTSKKLTRDGKYGPKTRGAWGVSARLRKLPDFFERVDGLNARVSQATYDKIKADGGVKPAPVPVPIPPIVPPPVSVAPVGTVDKSVAEILGLLYGVGWTTKKLANDPRFGPQVKAAWQGSAKLRGLPTRFERVDGRTARVDQTTYEAIKAKMPAKGAKPGPVTPPTGKLAETEQGYLGAFKQGETFKVTVSENPSTGYRNELIPTDVVSVVDSKYVSECPPPDPVRGPMTGCGGKRTFTLRARRSGQFQIVYIPPGQPKAGGISAEFSMYSIVVQAGAQPKPGPTGTVDKSVAEILGILYGLGWTTKKLANDPRFGPQVRDAWQGSAGLRKLPKRFERVDSATARVDATTYEALKNKMPVPGKPAKPGKPAPTPTPAPTPKDVAGVTKPVLELQKLLQALKWRARTVPLDGKFSTSVANAWATSAKTRGLDQTFLKVDPRTAKVSAKTFDAISVEVANIKPKPPPKPSKDKLSSGAKEVIRLATVTVTTEHVQQALALGAGNMQPALTPIPVTGVWDAATTEAFTKIIIGRFTPPAQKAWKEALGHLVASDGKSIKMLSNIAGAMEKASEIWRKQQEVKKPEPVPPPTPGPTPAPEPGPGPGPAPEPGPGPGPAPEPGPGPGPAPEPEPGPAPEPTPEPGPPAPSPEGASAWSAAVDALASFTARAAAFEDGIEAGKARGPIHPKVQEAYANWVKSFDALKARIASMIESSPALKSAIEAAGPTVGFAGYTNSLEAYFGDLEAVAEKAIELLRAPLAPEAGLSQASVLRPLAGRVAGAAWVKLMDVLRLPVVTAAGTVVAGGAAVNTVLTGETQAYLSYEQAMAQLLADGKITQAEYDSLLHPSPPMGGATAVILGLVALGGFALYVRSKRPGGP
jgi:predicted secreted protein